MKPADRVNETSKFGDRNRNPYDKMKATLEKSQIPSNLEILLQGKLGTYLNVMVETDPFKMISKIGRSIRHVLL